MAQQSDWRENDTPVFLISNGSLISLMQETLARGKTFRFIAHGDSMAPFICDGDVLTISPLPSGRIGLGCVVAFTRQQTNALVVHRVIARKDGAVLIHGDNLTGVSDGWVTFEYLLGCVTHVSRNGKTVSLGLGFERYAIAWLSRKHWLNPLRAFVAKLRGRE